MKLSEIERIKIGLMCKGIKLSDEFKKQFTRYRFKRASLSEGVFLILKLNDKETYVNAGAFENYVLSSPYTYDEREKKILKDGEPVCDARIFPDPEWYKFKLPDGKEFQSIVQEHGPGILATSITSSCSYKERGMGCSFCALSGSHERNAEDVKNVLKELQRMGFRYHELNINSGTIAEVGFGFDKYAKIAQAGKECGLRVYIQIPPIGREEMKFLKSAGVDSISFNLEIYNDEIRKKLCPGKSTIPKERYMRAIEDAVEIFGKGQVSSWLIIGLEPVEDTLKGIDKIIERGGIPYPTVFRPLKGTPLENMPPPSVEAAERVFLHLKEKMAHYGLNPRLSLAGCINCGCCTVM